MSLHGALVRAVSEYGETREHYLDQMKHPEEVSFGVNDAEGEKSILGSWSSSFHES